MGYIFDNAYLGKKDILLVRKSLASLINSEIDLASDGSDDLRAYRLLDIFRRAADYTDQITISIESSDFDYDLESNEDDA